MEDEGASRESGSGSKKKRSHNVWEHWKVIEKNPKGSAMDRVRCSYCPLTFLRHAVRCKKHLITCEGGVPDEVRKLMQEEVDTREPRAPYGSGLRGSGSLGMTTRKRTINTNFDDESEDGYDGPVRSQARNAGYRSAYDKNKAVELISDLLHLDDLDVSHGTRRKPLSQYTDEDFKKEERELDLKIKRETLRGVRLRNELFQRLIYTTDRIDPFLEKGAQAMEMYIDEKTPIASPPQTQVELVYTQEPQLGDGSNAHQFNPETHGSESH